MPTFYIGLFNRLPNPNDDLGAEVSSQGYERIPLGELDFVGDMVLNAKDLSFPIARGNWGTIIGFGLFDEFGRLLRSGPLGGSPIIVEDGTTLNFKAHSISISAMFLISPEKLREFLTPSPPNAAIPKRTLWERLTSEDD